MINWGNINTVIFDLDGTLVDTAPDLRLALNHCLKAFQIPTKTLDEAKTLVGHGARAMIDRALEDTNHSLSEEQIKELHQSFLVYYKNNIAVESMIFPKALEFLDFLKSQNKNLGICTNKPIGLAESLIKEIKLDQFFKITLGGDSVLNKKPDPSHLVETIEKSGGSPSNALYIGDSEIDFETAKNAKIPFILLEHGYSKVPLETLDPDLFFKNFGDCLSFFKNI